MSTANNLTDLEKSKPKISTPNIYYVDSAGDNGTAVAGNPARPYLTAQAAYDAGKTAAVNFCIECGVGSFSIYDTAGLATYCVAINGKGAYNDSRYLTVITISTVPVSAGPNADGTDNTGSVNVCLTNIYATVSTNGGDIIDVTDSGTYTAGDAASLSIYGDSSALVYVTATGGTGSSSAFDGSVTGGAAGLIVLLGVRVKAAITETGQNTSNGTPSGSPAGGTLSLDGCSAIGATFGASSTTANVGRTSYTSANLTPASDKGGNAAW